MSRRVTSPKHGREQVSKLLPQQGAGPPAYSIGVSGQEGAWQRQRMGGMCRGTATRKRWLGKWEQELGCERWSKKDKHLERW